MLVLLAIQYLIVQSEGQASLLTSVKILTSVKGWLQKAQDAHLGQPYVDWILQKLNIVHLYATAGQALAEKLDPDLVGAIGNAISKRKKADEDDMKRSAEDYISSWRYRPANIPAYVRKSKNKPGDEEDEEDLHSASSHGGGYGGGGYGGEQLN